MVTSSKLAWMTFSKRSMTKILRSYAIWPPNSCMIYVDKQRLRTNNHHQETQNTTKSRQRSSALIGQTILFRSSSLTDKMMRFSQELNSRFRMWLIIITKTGDMSLLRPRIGSAIVKDSSKYMFQKIRYWLKIKFSTEENIPRMRKLEQRIRKEHKVTFIEQRLLKVQPMLVVNRRNSSKLAQEPQKLEKWSLQITKWLVYWVASKQTMVVPNTTNTLALETQRKTRTKMPPRSLVEDYLSISSTRLEWTSRSIKILSLQQE